jgi:hypothetical protein
LVFVLVFYNYFERLEPREDINSKMDPIQDWYPVLVRNKFHFHLYIVHDSFVGRFKYMFIEREPDPFIMEDENLS